MTVADEESGDWVPVASVPNNNNNNNGDISDSDDEGFSTFMQFLSTPISTEFRHNPQKDIAEGGAKLVGHLLQKKDEDEEDDGEEEDKVNKVGDEETPSPMISSSNDYNAKIKEKKDAKKSKKKKKKKESDVPPATWSQVLSFLPTTQDKTLLGFGFFFGILNGLVYPILAYMYLVIVSVIWVTPHRGWRMFVTLLLLFLELERMPLQLQRFKTSSF